MARLLMVRDTLAWEPESLVRQVRSVLEPNGHTVEIAASTEEAVARLQEQDFPVLIVHVPSLWQCSEDVCLLLSMVRESSERKGAKVLFFSDQGGDGGVAEGYRGIHGPVLLTHGFHANELRVYVRRLLELP